MLNKIMLITYPDSMGHNLKDLRHILNRYSVHVPSVSLQTCRFFLPVGTVVLPR